MKLHIVGRDGNAEHGAGQILRDVIIARLCNLKRTGGDLVRLRCSRNASPEKNAPENCVCGIRHGVSFAERKAYQNT